MVSPFPHHTAGANLLLPGGGLGAWTVEAHVYTQPEYNDELSIRTYYRPMRGSLARLKSAFAIPILSLS
jgi:hypothetical protein